MYHVRGFVRLWKEQTAQTWRMLCERAVVEKDPDKLIRLIEELNRILAEKEARLQNARESAR